jgi:hypothetical protein
MGETAVILVKILDTTILNSVTCSPRVQGEIKKIGWNLVFLRREAKKILHTFSCTVRSVTGICSHRKASETTTVWGDCRQKDILLSALALGSVCVIGCCELRVTVLLTSECYLSGTNGWISEGTSTIMTTTPAAHQIHISCMNVLLRKLRSGMMMMIIIISVLNKWILVHSRNLIPDVNREMQEPEVSAC